MPGEGDELDFNLDEDLNDEDFETDEDLGDEADNDGDDGSGGDQHQAGTDHPQGNREEAPEVRQPSRAERRIETLDRERAEALARAERVEQQLREITQGQTRESEEAQFQRALADAEPWQRAELIANRSAQRTERTIANLRQEMADANDKAAFAAACASNPALARVKDEVETTLSQSRTNGVTLPREVVAAYLIGQKMLAKAPAAKARAGKKAAVNLARERAKPTTGGSDVQGGRGVRDERAARLERLNNASI